MQDWVTHRSSVAEAHQCAMSSTPMTDILCHDGYVKGRGRSVIKMLDDCRHVILEVKRLKAVAPPLKLYGGSCSTALLMLPLFEKVTSCESCRKTAAETLDIPAADTLNPQHLGLESCLSHQVLYLLWLDAFPGNCEHLIGTIGINLPVGNEIYPVQERSNGGQAASAFDVCLEFYDLHTGNRLGEYLYSINQFFAKKSMLNPIENGLAPLLPSGSLTSS